MEMLACLSACLDSAAFPHSQPLAVLCPAGQRESPGRAIGVLANLDVTVETSGQKNQIQVSADLQGTSQFLGLEICLMHQQLSGEAQAAPAPHLPAAQ